MSYILDALRKADAERERDPARGIHAQPAAAVPADAVRKVPAWTWPAATLAVAVAGVAAFLAWDRESPAPPAPALSTPAAAGLLARDAAPAVAPAPVILPVAAPAPERIAVVPKPAPVAVMKAAAVAAPAAPAAATAAIPAAAAAAAASAPLAVAAVADRVYAVGELPPDVQRELPKLAISGGVHSDNAAQRMLIVGGQVMNEGAELAPGVVLEQIRARSAVLRFRTWRYSVGY
jgi:general secretion pathway protein B